MFDYFNEKIALEKRDTIIQEFLDRHGLYITDWYSVMECGYLKAVEVFDIDDPIFPKFAYWLMRHELYHKRRETNMEKKINYPSFAWSPKRQKKLKELCQDGKSVSEIATYFNTDEDTVNKGILKYDLVKTAQEPAAEASAPACAAETPPAKASSSALNPEPNSTPVIIPVATDRFIPTIHATLKDLLHYVVDAANRNNDTVSALHEGDPCLAHFELGQQCAMLSEAEKIIKSLLNTFPEP